MDVLRPLKDERICERSGGGETTKIPQVGGAGLHRTIAHAQMCRHLSGEVPLYSPQLRVVNFDAMFATFAVGTVTVTWYMMNSTCQDIDVDNTGTSVNNH